MCPHTCTIFGLISLPRTRDTWKNFRFQWCNTCSRYLSNNIPWNNRNMVNREWKIDFSIRYHNWTLWLYLSFMIEIEVWILWCMKLIEVFLDWKANMTLRSNINYCCEIIQLKDEKRNRLKSKSHSAKEKYTHSIWRNLSVYESEQQNTSYSSWFN